MKKIFLAFILLSLNMNIQSQHGDHFKHTNKKIKLDIDESVFNNIDGNTYMSGTPKILFLSAFVVDSYENEKIKMLKFLKLKKFKKQGEVMMAGKRVFFIEGIIQKDGTDFINKNYCIKYNEKSVIMITTLLEVKADRKYVPMLEKIALSVAEKN